MSRDAPDLLAAFEDGKRVASSSGDLVLRVKEIGELVVTSGKVTACDPFTSPETPPFAREVRTGKYAVVLCIAEIGEDRRVARALVRIGGGRAVRFEPARCENAEELGLGEGELPGYCVDSGTGCFMDVDAARALAGGGEDDEDGDDDEGGEPEEVTEELLDELDENGVPSWSWAVKTVDPGSGANVVAFTTGYGDGVYSSWIGFDDEDEAVAIVTDFGVLDDVDPDDVVEDADEEEGDAAILLEEYVRLHNEGVRSGDFAELCELFDAKAELRFEGIAFGPFRGRSAIARAFAERPPRDEIVVRAEGTYALASEPGVTCGRIRLEANEDGEIARLVISVEDDEDENENENEHDEGDDDSPSA